MALEPADVPDHTIIGGAPKCADMPDHSFAILVPNKNTWQDAENIDQTHPYKSYIWIPEETQSVQIMKAHVWAEKFRAYATGMAAGGGRHRHTVDYGTKTSAAGGGTHSHTVTGQTAVYGGGHGHALEHVDWNRTTGSHTLTIAEMPIHRHEVVSTGDTHTADTGGDGGHTHTYKNKYAERAPVGGEHTHSVTGATSSVETPSHTHSVVIGAKTSNYVTPAHTHALVYNIEEEDITGKTLGAILYDKDGAELHDFGNILTGEDDVELDLSEYFTTLDYGMYYLELTPNYKMRVRIMYYEMCYMYVV